MAKTKPQQVPTPDRENWTHHRSIRIEDADWEALEEVAAELGGRATVVRRLIKLMLPDSPHYITPRLQGAVRNLPDSIHTGGDYRSPEAQAARK